MSETWAYQAANTIEITGDLTAKYWPNQLIKITQGTEKFFVVMAVALVGGNTRLTISGGGVYTLTSGAITAHHMTTNAAPVGLPSGFLGQGLAYGAASKDIPADGDKFSYWDSAASFIEKTITWANLKAALNLLYAPIAKGVTNGDTHDHAGGDGAELSQYAALAGRAGGQTLEGDTASSGNLTLKSTHHATKGSILIGASSYDELNNCAILKAASDTYSVPLKIANSNWAGNMAVGIEFWNGGSKSVPSSRIKSVLAGYGNAGDDIVFQNQTDSATNPNPNQPTDKMIIRSSGNVWIYGDCSALSFTDRTDAFVGNALAAIAKIAADEEGNIDHSTLPEFAQAVYTNAEGQEQAGRNIGNMVSVLTKGIQEMSDMMAKKDKEVSDLIARLEKLESATPTKPTIEGQTERSPSGV